MKNLRLLFYPACLILCTPVYFVFADESVKPAPASSQEAHAVTQASWRALETGEIISADDLRKVQRENPKLVIFDARDRRSYRAMHIEKAILSLPESVFDKIEAAQKDERGGPMPDVDKALAENMQNVPKDTPIVTYCNAGCKASAALLLKLKRLGFQNVKDMEEGIQAWQAKGYPLVIDPSVTPMAPPSHPHPAVDTDGKHSS